MAFYLRLEWPWPVWRSGGIPSQEEENRSAKAEKVAQNQKTWSGVERWRDQIVQGSQARVKSLGFFHVWGVEEGGCRSHSGHARGQVQWRKQRYRWNIPFFLSFRGFGVIKPVRGRRAVTALQGSCCCAPDLLMGAVCHGHSQRSPQPRYSSCVLLMICFSNSLKGVVGGGRVGGKDKRLFLNTTQNGD